jgi:ubiquinone/menaquinone biosynthesis C-methylase UbiE/uncharacterized protein YbaR (Trm112 family)
MDEKALEILRCQQCLGKLCFSKRNTLLCNKCKIKYPISQGLIFMGYDKNKKDEIEKIIVTERDHQTSFEKIHSAYNFSLPSFKIGLLSIDILRHDIKKINPKVIDIGCGGAPMSMMLSKNGFDVFCCDLEPNSLYSGFFWDYLRNTRKYIACDARILPFADDSVDVVYCKEFVHHVEDCNSLFSEINRVLKKNGTFLMIEPTLTYSQFVLKNPDEHIGHHYQLIFKYYSALKKNGFIPYRYYLYFYKKSRRFKLLNIIKNHFNKQIYLKSITSHFEFLAKMCIQGIIGGSCVFYSKKMTNSRSNKKRPNIQIISPHWLTLNENYLADLRLKRFTRILEDVIKEISQLKQSNIV